MSVIDDYLDGVSGDEKMILERMYKVVRKAVPSATEETSYGMPAFIHDGKGLVAIIANRESMSLYPFCSLERLHIDFSGFETTKGSLHFTLDKPVSDELLRRIIAARVELIAA